MEVVKPTDGGQTELIDLPVKVFADYVLIKQIMVKKEGRIIRTEAKDQKDKFDFEFFVVQVGDKVTRDIKVGDCPIFSNYVQFTNAYVLVKDDNRMESLVIVHENDILGIVIEKTPPKFELEK